MNNTHTEAISFLEEFVRIPSLSGQEEKAARFLVHQMQKRGFEAHSDSAGNAVGTIGTGSREILLLGHIDTVPGDVPVRIQDNQLYGRGSVDAKGCMATFILAAEAFHKTLKNSPLSPLSPLKESHDKKIIIVGAVEEEAATSKGARHIAGKYDPSSIIIGEPSGADAITLGYKGRLLVDAYLKKPFTHGSSNERNAVEELIELYMHILVFMEQYNAEKEAHNAPFFERLQVRLDHVTTHSDGLYQRADMKISFRIPPGFDVPALENYISAHRTVQQQSSEEEPLKLSFYGHEAPIRASKNTPLVRAFLRSMRKHNLVPRFKLKTGTSDMNILGAAYPGIPIAAYGPGDSSLDHTPHEHLDLVEYETAIEVLRSVLSLL